LQDEAKERRKAILSNIGEDLLLAANDQPFRFPATFTFVVRSFTVLDGIGKSLDPRCVHGQDRLALLFLAVVCGLGLRLLCSAGRHRQGARPTVRVAHSAHISCLHGCCQPLFP
jgi:hypothetical protein